MAPRFLACFGRGSATASAPDPAEELAPGPVLVELFSSQGCAASPDADAVAARLAQDSAGGVVVLGFHVDYWDYRGWKGPLRVQRPGRYGRRPTWRRSASTRSSRRRSSCRAAPTASAPSTTSSRRLSATRPSTPRLPSR
ncbi:hypothetical protein ACQ4PT_032281 [Festuca glaucescens]